MDRVTSGERLFARLPGTTLAGLFLSAAAWSAFVLFAWALVPLACDRAGARLLHLVAAAVLAAGAGGVLASLRVLRAEREEGGAPSPVAVVAVSLSVLFTAGIALFWVFVTAFDACWR